MGVLPGIDRGGLPGALHRQLTPGPQQSSSAPLDRHVQGITAQAEKTGRSREIRFSRVGKKSRGKHRDVSQAALFVQPTAHQGRSRRQPKTIFENKTLKKINDIRLTD